MPKAKLSERGANPRQVPPSTPLYISTKGVCIVQINKLSQSNHTSFNSRYKIPVTSAQVNNFEKHVVP